MELEELQKAWKELNERVSQNELVHQQQIIEMLSRQKESCLQRMLRMDKIASIFMLGVTILISVLAGNIRTSAICSYSQLCRSYFID